MGVLKAGNLEFRLVEQLVATADQLHALLVAGGGLGQSKTALFQGLGHPAKTPERLLEGQGVDGRGLAVAGKL